MAALNPELHARLILKMLQSQDSLKVLDSTGFDPAHLEEGVAEALDYIRSFHRRSGGNPPIEMVSTAFPDLELEALDASADTIGSLTEAIRDDHRHQSVHEIVEQWDSNQEEYLQDPAMYDALESQFRQVLRDHSSAGQGSTTLKAFRSQLYSNYVRVKRGEDIGFPIPFNFIQNELRGWRTSEIATMVSRTGIGKSWAACLCALIAAEFLNNPLPGIPDFAGKFGETITYCSYEMHPEEILERMAALLSGVPYGGITKGTLTQDQQVLYKKFLTEISEGTLSDRIIIVPPGDARTPERVVALARENNSRYIISDGLYLMPGARRKKSQEEHERIAAIWNETKQLALDDSWKHFYLATTQFNRSAVGFGTSSSSAISGSDQTGWASDHLIFLIQGKRERRRKEVLITLGKARRGRTGETYRYRWDWGQTHWEEIGAYMRTSDRKRTSL